MAIWLRFKAYIIGIIGLIAGVLAIYAYGRKDGSDATKTAFDKVDRKQARKIEDIADEIRKMDGDNATAIERLRSANRLRDL
jgi:hypothetical protein